jgi:outer membrane protein TolC
MRPARQLPLLLAVVLAIAPGVGAAPLAAPPAPVAPAPSSYVAPEYIRKPAILPPALVQGRRLRRMSLGEAIETALRRNLALALEKERVVEVATGRDLARSIFEPVIVAQGGRAFSKSPPSTTQEGQVGTVFESTQDAWSISILERLPTGTELRLDSTNGRARSGFQNVLAPELYRSALSLGVVQPLLRDFSFDGRIQRAPILRAEFASAVAREEARLRAMLAVKATEDAYWTLVQSCKSYEVNVAAQELAEKQLELTRRQIAAGVLPDSDVIAAEGTVAQRDLAVVRAEAQVDRAADLLRGLLNLPPGEWVDPILPVDAPSFAPVDVPFDAALARALASRPELKESAIDLRRIALDLDVAKNSRLPRLDLRGAVGTLGQDVEYRGALDDTLQAQGVQWSIGASFSWAPLGGAARAERRRLESALRQNGLGREQLLVGLRSQIREALRSIDTAERQLHASAKFRDLAERNLDVEQRRFLNSLSSNFLVAQRQAELAQARLAELDALIAHEKATSDLQLATGELLEARHLRFDVTAGG